MLLVHSSSGFYFFSGDLHKKVLGGGEGREGGGRDAAAK